jgi:nucleoid-associated protein YgaU
MLRQTAQKSRRKSARLQPEGLLNSEDRYMIDEFNNHPSRRKREHTWLWALPTVVLLAILVFWQAPLIERWLGISLLDLDTFVLPGVEPDGVVEIPAEDEQSTQLLEDTAEPSVATPEQIPTLEPTPLPTATPPPNIVEAQSPSPQPIAASGTVESLIVVSTGEQPVFDIAPYLELFGRADLSELDLNARRQNGTLVLEGVVTSTQQRSDLLDLAGRVPGVEEVNGIDLLIRLPETYVVEQADTLWSIAFELYGDGARWTEIFDANRDRLSNGSLLSPGQELIVPPLQGNP